MYIGTILAEGTGCQLNEVSVIWINVKLVILLLGMAIATY